MAAWPGSLPTLLEQGAQETRQQGFLRSSMDIGPPKQRARFTALSRFYSGTMLMTATQKATFDTFYTTTIGEGADQFDFLDPSDQVTTIQARFTGVPTAAALDAGYWRVTLPLEVLP